MGVHTELLRLSASDLVAEVENCAFQILLEIIVFSRSGLQPPLRKARRSYNWMIIDI